MAARLRLDPKHFMFRATSGAVVPPNAGSDGYLFGDSNALL